MSKKINGNMTLFELQAHCNGTDCAACEYMIPNPLGTSGFMHEFNCMFGPVSPREYPLYRRKTYKDDFLEKFPNTLINATGYPYGCVNFIYGLEGGDCPVNVRCDECWKRIMPKEE